MKGKVLGFDATSGTGAINGEDGKRYSFAAADNKSPAALKANDNVDFETDGGNAKNIYVTSGGAANVDLAAMASSPVVANILAKPNVIWAAIIILGSLIAGYLNAFSMMNVGGMGFLFVLLFLVPVVAGVLIFFELTGHAQTQLWRLVTAGVAIGAPILVPLIVGSGNSLGGIYGAIGIANDWFGLSITPGKLLMVGGGVLVLLTHLGIIKKLG